MEDGLVPAAYDKAVSDGKKVLILVVVEDGLVHAVEENNKNRKDES